MNWLQIPAGLNIGFVMFLWGNIGQVPLIIAILLGVFGFLFGFLVASDSTRF